MLDEGGRERKLSPWGRDVLIVLGIVGAFAGAAMVWGKASIASTPSVASVAMRAVPTWPVSLDGAPAIGAPGAEATLVVFSDFECPFCHTFAQRTWPAILQQYVSKDRLRVAFRHLPLEAIHALAFDAAAAAVCADQQGKFWEFHDLLFSEPATLTSGIISRHAERAGLGLSELRDCVGTRGAARVRADQALAASLGISSTPSLLIGTTLSSGDFQAVAAMTGSAPLSVIHQSIEDAIAKAAQLRSRNENR